MAGDGVPCPFVGAVPPPGQMAHPCRHGNFPHGKPLVPAGKREPARTADPDSGELRRERHRQCDHRHDLSHAVGGNAVVFGGDCAESSLAAASGRGGPAPGLSLSGNPIEPSGDVRPGGVPSGILAVEAAEKPRQVGSCGQKNRRKLPAAGSGAPGRGVLPVRPVLACGRGYPADPVYHSLSGGIGGGEGSSPADGRFSGHGGRQRQPGQCVRRRGSFNGYLRKPAAHLHHLPPPILPGRL